MAALFDMELRAWRRDRAARIGPELFLLERTFSDCLDRIAMAGRRFENALLIGCPDPGWPARLQGFADRVDVRDPGPLFSAEAGGETIVEDSWEPRRDAYDLAVSIGTLETVNDLPGALRLIRAALRPGSFFIGAVSGGDTLPKLRAAMRAADAAQGAAFPHAHPRIEASAIAPLLTESGFQRPVVDVDRVAVGYRSMDRLVADLRAMAATNVLCERPRAVTRSGRAAATRAFAEAGDGKRTIETFEIVHFAAWTASSLRAR